MRLGNESPKRQEEEEGPKNPARRDFLRVAVGTVVADKFGKIAEAAQANRVPENKFINENGNCAFKFTSENPEIAHRKHQ